MSAFGRLKIVVWSCLLAAGLSAATIGKAALRSSSGEPASAGAENGGGISPIAEDPWTAAGVAGPEQLAKILAEPKGRKPVVVFVGPTILYRSGHIPGARLIGPASRPAEMENLLTYARSLPKDAEIVLYCGCCPWDHCPNIRPAFTALQKLGFGKMRVLHLPHDFKQDWVDKGFPVQRGTQ